MMACLWVLVCALCQFLATGCLGLRADCTAREAGQIFLMGDERVITYQSKLQSELAMLGMPTSNSKAAKFALSERNHAGCGTPARTTCPAWRAKPTSGMYPPSESS